MSVIHLLHSQLELRAQDGNGGRRLTRGQDFLRLHRHLVQVLLETVELHLDSLCETEEGDNAQSRL